LDRDVAEIDDESVTGGVRSPAVDPDAARQLWLLSEEIVGRTFALPGVPAPSLDP
jgi:hypothetical protein